MAVNKVVYKHFEVKVSPAAAHAVDALLFGCGKINNDLNPDYNADLVNSVAFRASECTITRVVRKNADDESTVLYDGTPVNHFYLEYEPEDENDNGLFSITVKKTDGTNAMKVVTVPYGTNRRPVYAMQDEALRARMTTAEGDIDDLQTRMTTAEGDIDDNTQEINLLKARVSNTENQLTNLYGQPVFSEGSQYDIGISTTDLTLSKSDHPELFERLGAGNGPGASFICIRGFPAGSGTQSIGISLLNNTRHEVYFQKTVTYTSDGAPRAIVLCIDRITGDGRYTWVVMTSSDFVPDRFFEFANQSYGGTGYARPQDFDAVTDIRIVSSFDLADSTITTFDTRIKGGN